MQQQAEVVAGQGVVLVAGRDGLELSDHGLRVTVLEQLRHLITARWAYGCLGNVCSNRFCASEASGTKRGCGVGQFSKGGEGHPGRFDSQFILAFVQPGKSVGELARRFFELVQPEVAPAERVAAASGWSGQRFGFWRLECFEQRLSRRFIIGRLPSISRPPQTVAGLPPIAGQSPIGIWLDLGTSRSAW